MAYNFLSLYRGNFPIMGALVRDDKRLILSMVPLQGKDLPYCFEISLLLNLFLWWFQLYFSFSIIPWVQVKSLTFCANTCLVVFSFEVLITY